MGALLHLGLFGGQGTGHVLGDPGLLPPTGGPKACFGLSRLGRVAQEPPESLGIPGVLLEAQEVQKGSRKLHARCVHAFTEVPGIGVRARRRPL